MADSVKKEKDPKELKNIKCGKYLIVVEQPNRVIVTERGLFVADFIGLIPVGIKRAKEYCGNDEVESEDGSNQS
jgi:hypothetical protein